MSKFWDDDDNEESGDEDAAVAQEDSGDEAGEAGSGSGSGDSDDEDKPKKEEGGRAQPKRFEMDEWESSSDEKRKILTASEKLTQQLMESVGRLSDALELQTELKAAPKGHDTAAWPLVPAFVEAKDEVEVGLQLLGKYKKAVDEDGVPGFYVRALARFSDAVTNVSELAKKDKVFAGALPKDVAKQMATVARYVQKTVTEGKLVGPLVAEYRKDPAAERWLDPTAKEAAEEDLSEEEQKDKAKVGPKRGTREFWVKQPGDTSSEEENEPGDESWLDKSQESGEEDEKKAAKAKPGAKTKKHKAKTATSAAAEKAANKEEGDSKEDEDDESDDLAASTAAAAGKHREPMEEERELKAEDVDRLTDEMSQLRGRKGTDYPRLLQRLELILPKAKTDVQRIRLLILFVNTRFDSVRTAKSRLSAKDWRVSVDNIKQILKLLRTNPLYRLVELDNVFEAEDEEAAKEEEGVESMSKEQLERNKGVAASVAASGKVVISGSLFALLERLDSAFVRTLQQIDPHTQEYVTRLSDDPEFVALAKDMLSYQQSIADTESASKTAHSIIAHMYFRQADCTAELQQYAKTIYDHGTARHKAQAMLMCIYHYALTDRFQEARDRMLMSHLQDKAGLMDIETQILFNRTNVQIGLCAFRAGMIREAHSALSEIYAGGRVKELLAQGTSSQRYQDKDKEQEKVEKSRMMPYHMHINLELLETCHLIAAMMLEVPAMASEKYSKAATLAADSRVMSKYLRKLVDYHERQVFAGPPETTRDFVVAAARALSRGNWRKTTRLLLNMPAWELVDKKDRDRVKQVLATHVQEVGLKTYLFTYCTSFETLSIAMLAELFELSESRVHAIVSGMMLNDELKASWNQRTKTLVLHHVEPSSLQTSVLKYAARIGSFLESNEALLESRHHNFAYKHDGKDGKDDYQGRDGKDGARKFDKRRQQQGGGGGGGGYQRREDDRVYDEDDSRSRGSYKKKPYVR